MSRATGDLRVLMTADAVGGVWTYALQLARALGEHRVRVWLATMGTRPSEAQRRQAANIRNLHLYESDYALEWMEDPWEDVDAAGKWLLELERKIEADIVHVNGYAHASLPFAAPVVAVTHSCVCSWWQAVKGEPAPACWNPYRQRVRQGLLAADVVVGPTRAILKAVLGAHDLPSSGHVIPNGTYCGAHRGQDKQPLVLGAGRLWDEAKNMAALSLCAERIPWPVLLAGPTSPPSGKDARIPGARLLGALSRPELNGWMARAAIYVLPARYEPFGLSVLEAAQWGCALVLGDIDTLRENWDGAAVFVPPDDHEQLGSELASLTADPARRARLAAAARRRAASFSATRMGASYRTLYDTTSRRISHARRADKGAIA